MPGKLAEKTARLTRAAKRMLLGRQNGDEDLLSKLFSLYGVDIIFDIGANIGQSGEHFRHIGFKREIVSFEPVDFLYAELQRRAEKDVGWHTRNIALGDQPGQVAINVSGGHAGASSILEMTDNVRINAPDQAVVRQEIIAIDTVDAMMATYYPHGDRCFLKIDTQGYERNVLAGAAQSLERVIGIKLEMSLKKNYEGETMMTEMIPHLYELGFRLVHLEDGWSNAESKELYQVDGTFFRTEVRQ